jgi:hypothetical protein
MAFFSSQGGKTVFKAMRTFRHLGSLALLALVTPLLFACGGGGGSSAFVDEPVVSLSSGGTVDIAPGGSTVVGIVLSKPAPRSISIPVSVSGAVGQVVVPATIQIDRNASSGTFIIEAVPGVGGGSAIVALAEGEGYSLSPSLPTSVTVTTTATLIPTVSLSSGAEIIIPPGGGSILGIILNQPAPRSITIPLLVSGSTDALVQVVVPASVTIPAGQSFATFSISAAPTARGGSVNIALAQGSTYTLGTPSQVTVTVSPQVSSITLQAGQTDLPLNVALVPPRFGGPFTTTLSVEVRSQGSLVPGVSLQCSLVGASVDLASLFYLDDLDTAYQALVVDASAGSGSFLLHAENIVGPATVRCAGADPVSEEQLEASIIINIGGVASGRPSQVLICGGVTSGCRDADGTSNFLYVQGQNEPTQLLLQAEVVDEAGNRVPDPPAGEPNLFVRIGPADGDPDSPVLDGAELRSAFQDDPRHIAVSTINGIATFTLVSGRNIGLILLEVIADREDNLVSNGVQNEVSNQVAVPVVFSGFSDIPVSIVTETLANGRVGNPYVQALQAQDGNLPYAWRLRPGPSLPPGLSLSQDGVISGTPTLAGSFGFTVEVEDRFGGTDSRFLTLTIDAAPPLAISPDTVSPGQVGLSYAVAFSGSGGVTPYNWSATNPPPGLTMLSSGILAGTPTTAGSFSFVVTLRDALNVILNRSYLMVVNPGVVPEANFAGTTSLVTIQPDGSTNVAVVLDRPAPVALTINLLTLGDNSQFDPLPPATVTIPAGASSSAPFTVTADAAAFEGAEIEITLLPGTGYSVGVDASRTVRVGDNGGGTPGDPSYVLRLLGSDGLVTQGESVDLTVEVVGGVVEVEPLTVNVLVTGLQQDQFTVPPTVTLPVGGAATLLNIQANPGGTPGATIEVKLASGTGYTVDPDNTYEFTIISP